MKVIRCVREWCKALGEIIVIIVMFRMLGQVLFYFIQRLKALRKHVGSRCITPSVIQFDHCGRS